MIPVAVSPVALFLVRRYFPIHRRTKNKEAILLSRGRPQRLFANIKKAYFLEVSAFFAALSALWAEESAFIAEESAFIAEESTFAAVVSPLASVLELLLQAAKAPIASTKKNFFMFEFLMLIEWFPINTCPIKK
ncbi:MAG TPA: hypothetical protein VHC96_18330 [Puia sp.]|nr:hypothetical protein [Puia sp.]